MTALVVYESLWGNTEAVARAIAAGLGNGTRAVPTGEADETALRDADLVVVGCPVIAFGVPSDKRIEGIRNDPGRPPVAPDLSQPTMQSWLAGLKPRPALCAAFDTRVRGPFGSAAPKIARELEKAGYKSVSRPAGFRVKGMYGPLDDGEVERARWWGEELARRIA